MNAGRRAILYLNRRRNKSVLLFLLLFVITLLMLLCIIVGRGAEQEMQNLYETMGGYFKIETNFEHPPYKHVEDSLVAQIMEEYDVQGVNGVDTVYGMAEELTLLPGRFTMEGDEKAKLARVIGNTDTAWNEYFMLESLKLVDGRHIAGTDQGKALISEELAEANGLSTGDQLSLSYDPESSGVVWEGETEVHTFEIVGIFQIKSRQNSATGNTAECDLPENFVFVDTMSVREMMEEVLGRTVTVYRGGVLFGVENPKTLDRIVDRISADPNCGMEDYRIIKNNKSYEGSRVPLERLKGVTTVTVAVILVMGLILLSLVLLLWMRERVHEIGIYLSMGIGKRSVLRQHLFENLLLVLLAFLLSFGVAAVFAPTLGQVISVAAEEEAGVPDRMGAIQEIYGLPALKGASEAEEETRLTVRMDVRAALEIGILELGVVVLATDLSSLLVLRMKPRKILSIMS